jgi:hypothetical protein
MKPEDEKLFFGHDLATPLTNLVGAHYLLRLSVPRGDAAGQEALQILEANARTLERMLGWYWRLRELEAAQEPVEPWPAADLLPSLQKRIGEEALPLGPPAGTGCTGRLALPAEELEAGLLGAALTLHAAAKMPVAWSFEEREGVLVSRWAVEGDEEALDPGRLFRKLYWPSGVKVRPWLDPCLPYLRAVLEPRGGSLELSWAEGCWILEAVLPLVP